MGDIKRSPIVTLITDFGYRDHYVAAMKAVILSICPQATIVDVTHGVPKYDLRAGAYVLKAAYRFFPRGTVHVAVIDPGVGTERRGIAVKSRNYVFIGPDNGVLSLAALEDGVEEVRVIENRLLTLPSISHTFHGRDVFAPVAAHLARGVPFGVVGPLAQEGLFVPKFAEPKIEGRTLTCEVVYIDDFGNVVLNARLKHLSQVGANYGDRCKVQIREIEIEIRFLPSYGYVGEGEPLLLVNSEEHLELAVNRGNAAQFFGLKSGDKVIVSF
jgi:S-adenosylmethionine hydrolase